MAKKQEMPIEQSENEEREYWIVNPSGTVHSCDRAHAAERLREPGWRMATAEEIAKAKEPGAVQQFDQPFGKPFSAEPE